MTKLTILLQEDDCAPDARETFLEEFQKMFNVSFDDWKKKAKNISKYDDEVRLQQGNIYAYCSAHEPQWTISKL